LKDFDQKGKLTSYVDQPLQQTTAKKCSASRCL